MLLNKLTRWIVCGFFLIPTVIYASTKVTFDPKKSFAYIEISGQEAKNLWEYLKEIEGRGFTMGDASMSTSTLRSPVMSCMKSRYGDDGMSDKDPSLYYCCITLDDTGLPTYP